VQHANHSATVSAYDAVPAEQQQPAAVFDTAPLGSGSSAGLVTGGVRSVAQTSLQSHAAALSEGRQLERMM